MQKKYMFRSLADQKAVTGIIVAILLLGLFLSIIAFIQSVYVPQWMENKEAENTDEVLNKFTNLKSSIDVLTVMNQKRKPISTPIKVGTKELPFLVSQRAYGSLQVLPNDFKINVTYNTEGESIYRVFNLGSIKYTANNNYYMKKSVTYENGAVITTQDSGSYMSMTPTVYATTTSEESSKKISFSLIRICNFKPQSISGFGTYSIKTELISNESWNTSTATELDFETSHPKNWKKSINGTLEEAGLIYGSSEDYIFTDTEDGFKLEFHSELEVDVEIYNIKTTITSG
ncbi:MAG: hypothetical protein V5A64_00395 [Candidatus Thermoplasmatota archaeon]